MPNLDCSVKSCYYNKEQKCCLEGIRVRGSEANTSDSTACGSFREKGEGTFTNSHECHMSPEQHLTIQCEAVKCCYNQDKKCYADNVDIAGGNAKNYSETECKTFKSEGR